MNDFDEPLADSRLSHDPFSDLLWEESAQAEQRDNRRRGQVNLSAEIEDYLRMYV